MLAVLAMLVSAADPAGAQAPTGRKADVPRSERELRVERAQERCRASRGVDCDSREGLREWVQQERPISDEERAAAAGARRHREACSKSKSGC